MNNSIAAIYCRLSKEDESNGESESIQNQKSMLVAYAARNNWEIYNIYADDDYSGADKKRPAFNQMLIDAASKKFNIVLCKTQSRFSRDMSVIEEYIHGKFLEWKIRFVSVVDNADTNISGNKKARQINSLINEWYLEDLSENIRAVLRDKMRKGEFLSTYAPYGYKKDPDKKNHLIIDEETASVVKMIYDLHFDGFGAQKIARVLNEKKIPNPRKQKEISGVRKTKIYAEHEIGLWSTTTIGDILHNQAYCGDTIGNTQKKLSYKSEKRINVPKDEWIIVENTHSPIIPREKFFLAQRNLAGKRRSAGTGEVHALAGKVICYYCKKPMQKNHTVSKKFGHVGYLRCRNKYTLSQKCPTPSVRLDYIENVIKGELNIFIEQYIKNKDITSIELLPKNNSEKISSLISEQNKLTARIEKIDKALKSLYVDKASGLISDEQFKSFNEDFANEKNSLNKQWEAAENKLNDLRNSNAKKENAETALLQFIKTPEFTRNMITELIDYIEVGKTDEKTKETVIDINWSF